MNSFKLIPQNEHKVYNWYSIPLKGYPQPRGHRIVHRGRMNMIETVLESSNLGHQENIYIVGVISYRLFGNLENKIFLGN